ncbi:MAG: hypothetical protein KGD63_12140 [Candidatus Lokiarchaeota archaeon]|nr:hypothetical protein [Candidatus Lokiarchaeota archaeon]
MLTLWDNKADVLTKGDNLREILPIQERIYEDEEGTIHYVFNKLNFKNPRYNIPKNDYKLFKKFLDGGSRNYPSDGNIPLDIVATEARIIIHEIQNIAFDKDHPYFEDARETLRKGKYGIVRGCVKIYLNKYTTRDWRRKRFTDDIDFWIFKIGLFEFVLKKNRWIKNNKTKEWEKSVYWNDYESNQTRTAKLIASNDLNLRIDFTNGSHLEGSHLINILKKKLSRGHDVDLSDIINIAMVQNRIDQEQNSSMEVLIKAIEESANTRDSRIISNLISLCRHAYAICDYLNLVGNAIKQYKNLIFDKIEYTSDQLRKLCRYSSHWMGYLVNNGTEATRSMIYSYLIRQGNVKLIYSKNLKRFTDDVLKILNKKVMHIKLVFEISN